MKQEMREPAVQLLIKAMPRNEAQSRYPKERMPSRAPPTTSGVLDLEIIEKERPFGEKSPRKVLYRVKDHLFRFWHRFIPKALPMIEMGMASEAYDMMIKPHYNEYFGPVFEEICRQYLVRLNRKKRLAGIYTGFSRWWGANRRRGSREIT